MMTYEQCPWIDYLTDEDKVGYIKEIREDAPEDIKKKYYEHREMLESYSKAGKRMPKF